VKQINVMVFQFKLVGSMKIHPMFRVSLLKPYHTSTILGRIYDPSSFIEINGEHECEVQYILDS
jgi:hypothetical protein